MRASFIGWGLYARGGTRAAKLSTGVDALNLGNVAGTNPNCNVLAFEEKTLRSSTPLRARTDSSGALWVFFGTDSGFESTTEVYYRRAEITLDPA